MAAGNTQEVGSLAFLIKNWKLVLFGSAILAAVLGMGTAYILWERNVALREDLAAQIAQVEALEDARERDALAAHRLIEAMEAEQARLEARLTALGEITDEAGRAYLDAPVPDSVRRLLNP